MHRRPDLNVEDLHQQRPDRSHATAQAAYTPLSRDAYFNSPGRCTKGAPRAEPPRPVLGACAARPQAPSSGPTCRTGHPDARAARPLRVDVAGGGPVGLLLGLTLKHYLGRGAQVRLFDPRWHAVHGRMHWRGATEGNARRRQVNTLQGRPYGLLPEPILERMFVPGKFEEMWPLSADSPRGDRRPRNISICDIEDALLALAQDIDGIELLPEAYQAVDSAAAPADVLAICDGANSITRERYAAQFGQPDRSPYSIDGQHHEETILGLDVESTLKAGETVMLTLMNNRFLLNTVRGKGFLNMRLTADEARGLHPHGSLIDGGRARDLALWPRLLEGLHLFGIAEDKLRSVRVFRTSMVQRARFSAPLHQGTYGFLLGDAANAIHFWPGRGLNSGIVSAVSLARCLASHWKGRPLRDSDFIRHEGVMHMLQYRHKSRAWRTVVSEDSQGVLHPISRRIEAGLNGPFDAESDLEHLCARAAKLRSRLSGRLADLPTVQALRERLQAASAQTLRVLVESGAWVTSSVGGEEVELDRLLPLEECAGAGAGWTAALSRRPAV
jgi:2-polyprenyl-6-methoxyphenol hydroxylase-like FAD-dependent oxidoreductase